MAHKPRRKRLPPDNVREKIVAQQTQWADKQQGWVRQKEGQARDQAMGAYLLKLLEELHDGIQAAADTDLVYRPLVGANWYETMGLFNAYVTPLKQAGESDRLREVMQAVGMMDKESLAITFGLIGHALAQNRSQNHPTAEVAQKNNCTAECKKHDNSFDAGGKDAPA